MHRRASALAVALVVLVGAAGCGPSDRGELEIYGPYVGVEADIFAEVLRAFEEETGIETTYVGSSNFQSQFRDRVRAADLPDVVVLPQPALLTELIDDRRIDPLPDPVAERMRAVVGGDFGSALGSDGKPYAIPYRFVVKSLVWYRSDIFEDRGYLVPRTLGELEELVATMVADGETPWCTGMDSGTATGWWATDWVEDLVLRQAGPEVYQSWSERETPFTEPAITSAMDTFQQMVLRRGAFRGGSRAILNVAVEDAMGPMLESEPECLMHRQASFQSLWLPSSWKFGERGLDIFPVPPVEEGPPPLVISGEIVSATSDSPAAEELLLYLLDAEAAEPWRAQGGSLVASDLDEPQPDDPELERRLIDLVMSAGAVVFDASDLMPPEVGTDSFFTAMVRLVTGAPVDEVAEQIEESAPDSTPP